MVIFARGFEVAGVSAGMKKSGRKDVAIIRNIGPNKVVAAVFTSNRVHAAPVKYSRHALSKNDGRADAVLINSGRANACTGEEGYKNAVESAQYLAKLLGVEDINRIMVASTGSIGKHLEMDKFLPGIDMAVEQLNTSFSNEFAVASAICTTDTVEKMAVYSHTTGKIYSGKTLEDFEQVDVNENSWKIGAVSKGAGMIAPQLATMISVITTDAVLTSDEADEALKYAVEYSFNRIDADGCMSTNDTVFLLSSGTSKITPDLSEFKEKLLEVTMSLARQMIADTEGASHDIEITVINAEEEVHALNIARSVARSNLLKCAIFGNDPNWGRVLASIGVVSESDAVFDAENIDVALNDVWVCKNSGIGESRELVKMAENRAVSIVIDLKVGSKSATVLTNDLTYDYIKENAEYTT
jgi:glutamate N-acetyltransferase/amino-acid N-acetyltransferase